MNIKTFLFFLFTLSLSFSQNTRVEYYTFTKNTIDTTGIKSYLLFNNKKSLFVWKSVKQETKANSSQDQDESNKINIKKTYNDTIGTRVYNSFKDSILVLNEPLLERNYTVIDKKPNLKWQIHDEFKTIEGIRCQKAQGYFRGRNYIAWFSESIPIPSGPWKLGGLPGLIIEAYDTNKEVNFLFKSYIKNSKKEEEIHISYDDTALKIKEFVELKDATFKQITEKALAKLPRGTKLVSRKPSNRIGLETNYEWEEKKKED